MGTGAFTFGYAKGASYMTDDPRACANCHVMEQQYSAWLKGSHRSVAVCNDCHTPHNFFGKYLTKALNGWHHSSAFTTGDFPDPIRITGRTRFGGSEAIPHTPTQADPRSVVAQSRLEEDPRLKRIWAGYAFAEDFREERGHA